MDLSILIPTTPDRKPTLDLLLKQLHEQSESEQVRSEDNRIDSLSVRRILYTDFVVVIVEDEGQMTIGEKRNALLRNVESDYIAFIDSDDRISRSYIPSLMDGIKKGVDCCSLAGIITVDGKNPLAFEHSIKYNEYLTKPPQPEYKVNEQYSPKYIQWMEGNKMRQVFQGGSPLWVTYERYPNHLNCIKSSIAKKFKFPETNHGEDTDWATQIHKSGLIKTEHYIPEIIYYYDYKSKK